jgi:hypothetical protein
MDMLEEVGDRPTSRPELNPSVAMCGRGGFVVTLAETESPGADAVC